MLEKLMLTMLRFVTVFVMLAFTLLIYPVLVVASLISWWRYYRDLVISSRSKTAQSQNPPKP